MFHVSKNHLRGAFRQLKGAANGLPSAASDAARLLLLMYSAECGLKAKLLDERRLHHSSKLEEDDLTHDVDALLGKLNASSSRIGGVTDKQKKRIATKDIHQALRYGHDIGNSAKNQLKIRLENILNWIEEVLQ